ncbi:protein FAR-RED ELONGATED HYPOCOTYL 3-like [Camellia sinensis]|uniref:protein FAR-RED ELONGATED HYPOCOTYL 3-like n=1 Tax=Camellia sinensis TaxID=4442 RepID=UPI001035A082|nr:protein FAR-RED ELONGATED HYPOCOTYL 3-like [Camellia sinensis]
MHAFFDGYINSKTTLKQFVEQYENAMAKKVENENGEFNSLNSYIPCITQYPFEKQFQNAYTIAKFKEFQQEVVGKIYCNLSLCSEDLNFSVYEVSEDVPFGESLRLATFTVYLKEDSSETNCSCRLFEFRGIVCRHQIAVLMKKRIHQMPDKYILRRWNKNVKRCHTKVHISYDNSSIKPEARRYDKMFNVFNELRELKGELKEEVDVVSGSNKFGSMSTQNASSSYGDGVLNSKESTTILDPIVVYQKGRPPCKRKQFMLEKTIKKKQRVKTKTKTKTTSTSSQGNIEQSEFSAPSHMGFVDLGTQESIKINESEMLAPSFGQQNMLQGHLSSQGHHHPSQSWMLGNSSFTKMLNDMAHSQSENPERDKDERS